MQFSAILHKDSLLRQTSLALHAPIHRFSHAFDNAQTQTSTYAHQQLGEFISERSNGEKFALRAGMAYIVSDDMSSHRSTSEHSVKLLIVEADFLNIAF